MATAKGLDRKTPRGRARLELEGDGKTLAVHLDRPGFRRLLQTLQRLAETGEPQTFEKSGRARAGSKNGSGGQGDDLRKMVFRIDDDTC